MAIPPLTTSLPIPADLKTPHPQTPWRISPNLFSRISQQPSSDTYKKQELLPTDPEFPFVYQYFNHQKPTNRSIAKVYCIHNPNEATVFENKLPSLEAEASNPFFQQQWATESLAHLRQKVIDRFKSITALFSPFEIQFTSQRKQTFTLTKVLPLWHGSSAVKCDSICRSGFTFFGKHGFTGGGCPRR